MSDFISKKQLADEKGVAYQRIDKMVREGKLALNEEGLISRSQAEEVWATLSPSHLENEAIKREVEGGASASPLDHPLVKARTMEAVFRAKQRELTYKIDSGKYVPIEKVKTEAFDLGRSVQQKLLTLPARLAPELAVLAALPADQIEPAMRKRMTDEVKRIISDLITGLDLLQAQPN